MGRGRAEAGQGLRSGALPRGFPAAHSPGHPSVPRTRPLSVVISSERFREGPLGSALTAAPRGLCSHGLLPSLALVMKSLGAPMMSHLLLPPPRVTCTAGLRTIPLGAWIPSPSPGDVPLGKPGLGWDRCGNNPPWGRVSLREDFGLCSPPALGSPGRGGRRARPLGAHVESTAPRCRRDAQTPRTLQGCQPSPSGRMDPPDPPGQRGAWQEVGTGVIRRGFPALARRRERSSKG